MDRGAFGVDEVGPHQGDCRVLAPVFDRRGARLVGGEAGEGLVEPGEVDAGHGGAGSAMPSGVGGWAPGEADVPVRGVAQPHRRQCGVGKSRVGVLDIGRGR